MEQDIHNEIIQLHQFFQNWFNGMLPFNKDNFSRLENALEPGFLLINPYGSCLNRDGILDSLRSAYNTEKSIRIWIEKPSVKHSFGNITIATYQEWQKKDQKTTSRFSTVVFRAHQINPNGVRWVHVHETWINS
jgi:hypothetical protein